MIQTSEQESYTRDHILCFPFLSAKKNLLRFV